MLEAATADLDLLRGQDAGAFARLVEEHQGAVMGLAQSLGLRGFDRDAAAADAFANVYRALPAFQGRSGLGTWVYRIAFRTIVKARHRQARRQARGEAGGASDAFAREQADPSAPSPEASSQAAETNQLLWDAVAALDPRQAMAVELFYRREWPVEKVARVMECPAGTIKTLLFRARDRLRGLLSRKGLGP